MLSAEQLLSSLETLNRPLSHHIKTPKDGEGVYVCMDDFLNVYFLSENRKLDNIQKESDASF